MHAIFCFSTSYDLSVFTFVYCDKKGKSSDMLRYFVLDIDLLMILIVLLCPLDIIVVNIFIRWDILFSALLVKLLLQNSHLDMVLC